MCLLHECNEEDDAFLLADGFLNKNGRKNEFGTISDTHLDKQVGAET